VQYEIAAGGRTRRVTVTRAGSGFAVTVDGRTKDVDVVRVDAQTLSLILDGGTSEDAVITVDRTTGQLSVVVDGVAVPVAFNGRGRRGRAETADGTSGHRRPQRVTAPMPGKLVRVLVGPGDAVAARQPVVVVEAMKMENELRAVRDGTVAEVHAREGQLVEAGSLLVVIQ
jgi:biotin carboxyl carrier protein